MSTVDTPAPVQLGQVKKASYAGDGILKNMEMGTAKGFSHVADYWLTHGCMSYEQGKAKVAEDQGKIEDFETPLSAWVPVVNDRDQFALRHKESGRDYIPTDHAIKLMCQVGKGMAFWGACALRDPICHATKEDPETGEKVILHKRGRADAEVLRDYVKIHLFHSERVDQNKVRLFRTWNDGTLRALLSQQYAIVNNMWYLDLLAKLIPGGMLSHWKGDADAIYGNILIPDTIRKESDSDYGGMLSIGNSEIGTRRITSCPSVFRAICMNGCIWDQESGIEVNQVHRGKVDFEQLAATIQKNLESQIPLLPVGIQRYLGIRAYGVGDTPLPNLMAQLSLDYSIGKKEVKGIWDAYAKEVGILGPKDGQTAFGLSAAVTRFGQELDPGRWVTYDGIGGDFANMSRDEWDKFRTRAKNLSDKQVEKRVGELLAA